MNLCIPLRAPMADGARDAFVEPYFPRARYLYLYDTESGHGRTLDLANLAEEAGTFRIEAVLCTSLDRKTLRQMQERGIAVYGTDAETFQAALGQYQRGELIAAEHEPESSGCGGGCGKSGGCGGHGHDGQGPAGHEHGSGAGDSSAQGHEAHGHGGCGGGGCGHGGHAAAASGDRETAGKNGRLRIALCSQNRKTLTGHAGKCRKFWIYTVYDGIVQERELLELPLEQALHSTADSDAHPLDGVDVLIAGSMGSGLQARLRARGVLPRISDLSELDAAVAAFLSGDMPAPNQDAEAVAAPRRGGGCSGHGH